MSSFITIIIPYYCTPKELFEKCMASLLSVKTDKFHVLVIDDGSPLAFFPILDQYSKDSRVTVIHQENAGVSAARNLGIKEADGKWIMFVDSDDYVETETLEKIIMLDHVDTDIVIFNGGSDNNGEISRNTTFLEENINYGETREKRCSLMESALAIGCMPKGYKQYFTLGAPYCKMMQTRFLRNNNLYFDEKVKFAEDTLFSIQAYVKARNIRFYDMFLYYYVNNPGSVTRKYRPGLAEDMDVFFRKVSEYLKNAGLDELNKAYYFRAQFEVYRCFEREFFHPDNKTRNKVKKRKRVYSE